MKAKEIKIMSYDELKAFISEYFDLNKELVFKVVGASLDCYCWDIFNLLDVNEFLNRVDLHYNFLQGLGPNDEKLLFLLDKPTLKDEFSIKQLMK